MLDYSKGKNKLSPGKFQTKSLEYWSIIFYGRENNLTTFVDAVVISRAPQQTTSLPPPPFQNWTREFSELCKTSDLLSVFLHTSESLRQKFARNSISFLTVE